MPKNFANLHALHSIITMIDTQNLKWQDWTDDLKVPDIMRFWLVDTQSLTAKLRQKYPDFAVQVLSEKLENPHKNEVKIVGETPAIIRKVVLFGNSEAVVFARSIIPVTDDTKNILKIGKKPLGEMLFNDSKISRGSLQITDIDGIWGRRSSFTIGTTSLLVSEFFLPFLYA